MGLPKAHLAACRIVSARCVAHVRTSASALPADSEVALPGAPNNRLEAFESLLNLGLARHADGRLFTLTVRGLTLGRAIAESLRPEVTQ